MTALLLSNAELFLANFLWVWGGPLPAVLLGTAALLTHLGERGGELEL